MADAVRLFVEAVHSRLAVIHGSTVKHLLGAKHWHANASPPLVKWAWGDIDHDVAKTTGGETAAIYTRNQTLLIRVWDDATVAQKCVDEYTDEEAATALFSDLLRALRIVVGTTNFKIGRFRWITEDKPGWLNRGAALEGFIVADIQVPESSTPAVLVEITTQTHTQTLDPLEPT
jgi:hypothetical protein